MRIITAEEKEKFLRLAERRLRGEPLQYILGTQEFMGLRFNVNPKVLIPRQDTETLVEEAIRILKDTWGGKAYVLDLGTGSGAIAVSVAYYVQQCCVKAVDVDEEALRTAIYNAEFHGLQSKICFQKSDLFQDLPDGDKRSFHLILSNPPYIPSADIPGLQREVKEYEPHLALDGGIDGLNFYRRIGREAPLYLQTGGMLLLEVGYNQAEEVKRILQPDFSDIYFVKDLTGINRVVVATMKETGP